MYELTNAGELEVAHIGRCARIPTAALDAFVDRIGDQTVTNEPLSPTETTTEIAFSR